MKKLTTLLLSCLVLLSLCISPLVVKAEEITDFVDYETQNRELETINIFEAQSGQFFKVLTNLVDPLLTHDNHGHLVPNIATDWHSEDNGKTWTFNLRDDVVWVDVNGQEKAKCIAEDWLWAMEWILNFHKNGASNTSMPIQLIEGASDYYEYTKGLEEEEAMALGLDKFQEMVRVEAPDDTTLVYHCLDEFPYFPTVCTYACMYPLSGKLIEEIGVEGYKSLDNTTMWYNGPYTMTTFVLNNEKVLTRNPLYFNEEAKLFDTVTIKMLESQDQAYQLYQTGEIDRVALSESNLQAIYRNEGSEFNDYLVEMRPDNHSYQIHLCFDKYNEDGQPDDNYNTAIRNEDFRLSIYYGLQLEDYLRRVNTINPLECVNFAYTQPGVSFMSDGTDYVDVVLEELNFQPLGTVYESYPRFVPEKFEEHKSKAKEALLADGVEFPVEFDYYIKAGDQTALDNAMVLKTVMEDSLGSDYITVNLKEYVSSLNKEVRTLQLSSMYITGWGADFGDPVNFLAQEIYGDDNAINALYSSFINSVPEDTKLVEDYKTFTEMVHKAAEINDDLDARYRALAKAEAFMIEKAFVIPLYQNISWELTTVNPYSCIYCPYGIQTNRYINWETNSDGITTEEAAQYKQAYEEGKAQ